MVFYTHPHSTGLKHSIGVKISIPFCWCIIWFCTKMPMPVTYAILLYDEIMLVVK